MTSLAEQLALKISKSNTTGLSRSDVDELVWDDGDVPLWEMSDADMDKLVDDVHYAIHHKIILTLKEK